mgnify:CR=1 FL=1
MNTTFIENNHTDMNSNELFTLIEKKLGFVPEAYKSISASKSYLNDTLYNFHKHVSEGAIDLFTKHIITIAVASALHNQNALNARLAHAKSEGVNDDLISEAIAVTGNIMTQNIFFKFQRLAGTSEYSNFRPAYKLNTMLNAQHLSQLQVESICIAISLLNDCADCLRGHIESFHKYGGSNSQLEEVLRVTALTSGFCTTTF